MRIMHPMTLRHPVFICYLYTLRESAKTMFKCGIACIYVHTYVYTTCTSWGSRPRQCLNVAAHLRKGQAQMRHLTPHTPDLSHIDPPRIWVMSHMNESCHIWRSHVTYEEGQKPMQYPMPYTPDLSYIDPPRIWVMSHINESWHIRRSHVTYEERHTLMQYPRPHTPDLSRIDPPRIWVMSRMNDLCQIWTGQAETCHIWTSHVTYEYLQMNESC